jgi:hypothetical protein
MFIVSSLVPGRPVDTAQVTPRSRDATSGMSSLGLSTGPLKHLKIVSRVDTDHYQLLKILAQSNSSLETISFEICGQLEDMRVCRGQYSIVLILTDLNVGVPGECFARFSSLS